MLSRQHTYFVIFSGKTSLLLAILRMIEVRSGSICVDDIDVSAHARQSVRRQITTLPQDTVTLPGTVRANLDPYSVFDGEANDSKFVAALDRVSLWDVIGSRGGLDTDLEGLGLSHGQMQLFGLARAFLHKDRTRLLLLDEATSSVDRETDGRLQTMIREDFAACTVVAVAHRLETVLQGYDMVVVMERGMVVEMADARSLMEDRGSVFYRLMAG